MAATAGDRRFGLGTILLTVVLLAWTLFCVRSWIAGESGMLGDLYYQVRDKLQPDGYAITGDLTTAPSWVLVHLGLIVLPWLGLFVMRAGLRVLRGRRSA